MVVNAAPSAGKPQGAASRPETFEGRIYYESGRGNHRGEASCTQSCPPNHRAFPSPYQVDNCARYLIFT
jgi:hypothetical protein